MGHFFGIDWLNGLVIGWSVWQMGRHPRWAVKGFMVANFLSSMVALWASPVAWGSIVSNLVFFLLHLRNLRGGRIAAVTSAGSAPEAGSRSEASTCPTSLASYVRSRCGKGPV